MVHVKLFGLLRLDTGLKELNAEAGSVKASNVALIGLAADVLGFERDVLRGAVAASVPQKALEINLKAFDLGYDAIQ